MGSPTKEKFREGVQQEILTNYYMSRYDKIMSRMNEKKVETVFAERLPSQGTAKNPKRKNFKELILQKKANQKDESERQLSGKRNFKHQIEHKNSKQKVQKENKKNFYRLEDTIISELYKPSPSQLEKGRYTEIEVLHKISYDEKRQKIQPFRLVTNEEEESIEINYLTQQKPEFLVEVQKIQHQKLSSAIKSSFERRKSPTHRTPSKSKNKQDKKPPKSPHSKVPPQQPQPKSQQESHSRQDSYFFETVRPSFENMERNFPKTQNSQHDRSFQKKINFIESDRLSNTSKISKQRSVERNHNRIASRRSSLSPSLNEEKKKNSSNVDDSFHRSIPQIQQEPKISPRQKQKEKQQERSESRQSDRNKSLKSSRVHNESELKDSLNDFSMVSRFSMISEEGMAIQEDLQRQLNENEFGPYQNALTSLLSLIGEYPNAWPIYVVGQRILEDRHQYENKRMMQQNEISRLQAGIQSTKRARQRYSEIENNNIEILNLVRQLSRIISPAI